MCADDTCQCVCVCTRMYVCVCMYVCTCFPGVMQFRDRPIILLVPVAVAVSSMLPAVPPYKESSGPSGYNT